MFSDKKSLKKLLVQTIQTPEQHRWASKLQGFSFEIFHKLGKSNRLVNALNHTHTQKMKLSYSPSLDYFHYFWHNLRSNTKQKMRSKHWCLNLLLIYTCNNYLDKRMGFFIARTCFSYWVSSVHQLQHVILIEYHSTPIDCHAGLQPTLVRLSAPFLWPDIYKDVNTFVERCTICQ